LATLTAKDLLTYRGKKGCQGQCTERATQELSFALAAPIQHALDEVANPLQARARVAVTDRADLLLEHVLPRLLPH
jgi:hypothetical protein